ncbi:MAG: acyltransferase domain-containing protein, partial [bacterium]|nr:acyltransferase domain-containing protein [bacterium]
MKHPKTAFVFSGIGSQWQGMGTGLFSEDEFRTAIELCDEYLTRYTDWTIKEELVNDGRETPLERSLRAPFCIFALQAGLVALLRKWSIVPDAVIGHSVGEFAAAYTAGALTLKDAVPIVWHHHQIMRNLAGTGRMAHLSISAEETRDILQQYQNELCVSAINSPRATVVSGAAPLLQDLTGALQQQGIFCRILNVDVPLHSPHVIPYSETLERAIHDIEPKTAALPFYSTVLGTRAHQALKPSHWVEHIQKPVLFAPAIEAMKEDGYQFFIEIGPHPVLKTSLEECLQDSQQNYELFETLKREESEKAYLLRTLAKLHHKNYPVNWEGLSSEDRNTGHSLLRDLAAKSQKDPLVQTLRQTDPNTRKRLLIGAIEETITEVSHQRVSLSDGMQRGFLEMGLDSLMAVDMKNALESRFERRLPSTLIFDYPTVDTLADYLALQFSVFSDQSSVPNDQSSLSTEDWSLKTDLREPIAVIGMGCRFPGGANNPELFWENLKNGVDATSEVPAERWNIDDYYDPAPDAQGKMLTRRGGFLDDISYFDAGFFGISAREAQNLDPQQLLLLEVAWEALENAMIPVSELKKTRTGVYIGICANDFQQTQILSEDLSQINVYSATGSLFSCAAGRLSYLLDLQGPNFPIDTACSSSLVALHLACQDLRSHQAETALVGGVNALLTPNLFVYFSRLGAISPDGRCKTFDASANGYGRGEGCGVLVLKRLSDARADGDRVLALVRGSSVNHDGLSSSFTAPNGIAQQEVIRQALHNAGLSPEQVQYIETHGTGTALGDPIEVRALGEIYGKDRGPDIPLILGSVKANIGHLEGAAGITSLIKTILAFNEESIPPQAHFQTPNPLIPWDEYPIEVPTELLPWQRTDIPRLAGVSAFGVSGTNAHVILEEAPLDSRLPEAQCEGTSNRQSYDRPIHLLNLSAKNEEALKELAVKYAEYLKEVEGSSKITIGDMCYTANVGREHFQQRFSVSGNSKTELAEKLLQYGSLHTSAREPGTAIQDIQSKTVFLFTGQGSQYKGMGRELYQTHPLFRQIIEECDTLFQPYLERSLQDMLYNNANDAVLIHQTAYTQPAIFAIEYALAKLWQSWGIRPAAVVGHSIGEYVAACVAGVFSLKDAAGLVAARGRLMQSLPQDGMMAAVFADETTVLQALKGYEEQVSIAAINAPTSVVISGERKAVESILVELQTDRIDFRRLQVSHAFHSPLMNPILEEFKKIASEIIYAKPTVPLISNVTGTWA